MRGLINMANINSNGQRVINTKVVVSELHRAFKMFNDNLFAGQLPEPAILIQSRGNKKLTLGWCSVEKIWKNNTTQEEKYEINLVAEAINRGVYPVMATLLHEMVHLHNMVYGIKDTSRGYTYHNKQYKKVAEEHGLEVEHGDKVGWAYTKLQKSAMDLIDKYVYDEAVFSLGRLDFDKDAEEKPKKKSSSRKYICPECGTTIRASKDVFVLCGMCTNVEENKIIPMIKEKSEDEGGETPADIPAVSFVCNDCGTIGESNEEIDESIGAYVCKECGSINTEVLGGEDEEGEKDTPAEEPTQEPTEIPAGIVEIDTTLDDGFGIQIPVKQGMIDLDKTPARKKLLTKAEVVKLFEDAVLPDARGKEDCVDGWNALIETLIEDGEVYNLARNWKMPNLDKYDVGE